MDGILVEQGFTGNQDKVMVLGLCDKDAVEGVVVMTRQGPGENGVIDDDGQFVETLVRHVARDVENDGFGFRKLADAMFGRDFSR